MNRPGGPTVVEVAAADTHLLRRAVLRAGTPTTEVRFEEDEWPGVVHLAVAVDADNGAVGDIVATSTWVPRTYVDPVTGLAEAAAVQLRGMATATALQGTGIGGLLLEAGCAKSRDAGAAVVWARARDSALDFYRRHGFEVRGDGFLDATTRLAHHLVLRRL